MTIQWIPGYSNIFGKEMRDFVTKQAWSEYTLLGVTYTAICARIRHVVKYPPFKITSEIYREYLQRPESTGITPYWKVQKIVHLQKTIRCIWPHMHFLLSEATRYSTLVAEMSSDEDLMFLVRIWEDWLAWQNVLYRKWHWQLGLSLGS